MRKIRALSEQQQQEGTFGFPMKKAKKNKKKLKKEDFVYKMEEDMCKNAKRDMR